MISTIKATCFFFFHWLQLLEGKQKRAARWKTLPCTTRNSTTIFDEFETRNELCTLRNAPRLQYLVVIASVIFNEIPLKWLHSKLSVFINGKWRMKTCFQTLVFTKRRSRELRPTVGTKGKDSYMWYKHNKKEKDCTHLDIYLAICLDYDYASTPTD